MSMSTVDAELWLRRFHPARAGAPSVVCFPHTGGSASSYHPISAILAPRADMRTVQYPGRQDRRAEPAEADIVGLAGRIADVLTRTVAGPMVFWGHSFGAVVAFEVARAFAARGADGPAHLFVAGRRGPTRFRDERVHQRDDQGLLAEVELLGGRLRRGCARRDLGLLPVLRADYRALETYRCSPGVPLACPVTALIGDDDAKTSIGEARAWAEVTTGSFDLRVFPGGHYFFVDNQPAVITLLTERLAALDGP
ncbi:thioesterase II family protein [Actinokineospora sp.]|uniref:thioesterase II family protein n=1 Tax=Actinokineospora sp. TaxID=1872133 RepID=UPI004037D3AF